MYNFILTKSLFWSRREKSIVLIMSLKLPPFLLFKWRWSTLSHRVLLLCSIVLAAETLSQRSNLGAEANKYISFQGCLLWQTRFSSCYSSCQSALTNRGVSVSSVKQFGPQILFKSFHKSTDLSKRHRLIPYFSAFIKRLNIALCVSLYYWVDIKWMLCSMCW